MEEARRAGILVLGPNMVGLTYVPNHLNAVFWPVIDVEGPLAVVGQSGSVTIDLAERAARDGVGISAMVNLGNQADLCETDVLDFLSTDEATAAIALYLEGLRDGRRFLEVAARVSREKPVVVLKAGRSPSGRRAVASHTASLAGDHVVFDHACRERGILTAPDLDSLYDMAKGCALVRRPRGPRVFCLSSSGGAAALVADEAERLGLQLPQPSTAMVHELEQLDLSPRASLSNPLDLGYSATDSVAAEFERAVGVVHAAGIADTVVFCFADPIPGGAQLVERFAASSGLTVVVAYFAGGTLQLEDGVRMQRARVPVYPTPERALRVVAALAQGAAGGDAVAASRERRPDASPSGVHGQVLSWLPEPDAISLVEDAGVPFAPWRFARTLEDVVGAADGLGYPVVLKVVSPQVLHKSAAGGVVCGIANATALRVALPAMRDAVARSVPDARIVGYLVMAEVPAGPELMVGTRRDATFGPVVTFGLGGTMVEMIADVAMRLVPCSREQARAMVGETRAFRLLAAYQQGGASIEALIDVILATSRFMEHRPEVEQLDINPLRLQEGRLLALDARVGVRQGEVVIE